MTELIATSKSGLFSGLRGRFVAESPPDRALHAAKAHGRNRVVAVESL